MKYTKEAAMQLVGAMDRYAESTAISTRSLANTTVQSSEWKDSKHSEFCNLLSGIINDITEGCATLEEYRDHLLDRINKLG